MDKTFSIFAIPRKCNVNDAPLHLQMELIQLQEYSYLKSKYDDVELSEFYRKHLSEGKYTQLSVFARKIICTFGSTYKCAQLFKSWNVIKISIVLRSQMLISKTLISFLSFKLKYLINLHLIFLSFCICFLYVELCH